MKKTWLTLISCCAIAAGYIGYTTYAAAAKTSATPSANATAADTPKATENMLILKNETGAQIEITKIEKKLLSGAIISYPTPLKDAKLPTQAALSLMPLADIDSLDIKIILSTGAPFTYTIKKGLGNATNTMPDSTHVMLEEQGKVSIKEQKSTSASGYILTIKERGKYTVEPQTALQITVQ